MIFHASNTIDAIKSPIANRQSPIADKANALASTRAGFWRTRPVFVTGATGFLGGVLVRQLLQLGADVTCLVRDFVPDCEYSREGFISQTRDNLLQLFLTQHPDAGVVMPSCGGLRKIRWRATGRGKRGGARVIYYWIKAENQLLMLFIYAKNELDNLSEEQKRQLRRLVENELGTKA